MFFSGNFTLHFNSEWVIVWQCVCSIFRVWPSPLPAMWCLPNSIGTLDISSRRRIEPTASDRPPRSMCTTSLPKAPLTPSCGPCLIGRFGKFVQSSHLSKFIIQSKLFQPYFSNPVYDTVTFIFINSEPDSKKAAEYWMSHSCPHRKRWQAARWMGGRNIWRRSRATRTSGSSSALLTRGCRARWFCRWMGIQEISRMTCSSHMWVK